MVVWLLLGPSRLELFALFWEYIESIGVLYSYSTCRMFIKSDYCVSFLSSVDSLNFEHFFYVVIENSFSVCLDSCCFNS